MNFKDWAATPPMGWNSYDYYNTSVTEDDVKRNADYMAKYLKPYGWEYVVVDIEWYACHEPRCNDEEQYVSFGEVAMDEYSRLVPSTVRFPSAADGKGFKPLADYVHSLGLKFGIHIMRGIPRIAAHLHTKVLGTDLTADKIANHNSICWWNPDMYGVRTHKPEAQLYYDSIFALYAEWGVDFIKCDDICRMDAPSAKEETRMLHRAIEKCGRPMVLSLSPGAAKIEEAKLYEQTANMWRITDDFWDDWKLLYNMFERCEVWEKQVAPGNYPDCDMLTIGKLSKWHFGERDCRFTEDEVITMLSLWSIFKSPMMIGAELPKLTDRERELLTNQDVLALLGLSAQARQLERDKKHAIWMNLGENGEKYIALFNLSEEETELSVDLNSLEKYGIEAMYCAPVNTDSATELWTKEGCAVKGGVLTTNVKPHATKLFCVK